MREITTEMEDVAMEAGFAAAPGLGTRQTAVPAVRDYTRAVLEFALAELRAAVARDDLDKADD